LKPAVGGAEDGLEFWIKGEGLRFLSVKQAGWLRYGIWVHTLNTEKKSRSFKKSEKVIHTAGGIGVGRSIVPLLRQRHRSNPQWRCSAAGSVTNHDTLKKIFR
jgi:hypothetical protein